MKTLTYSQETTLIYLYQKYNVNLTFTPLQALRGDMCHPEKHRHCRVLDKKGYFIHVHVSPNDIKRMAYITNKRQCYRYRLSKDHHLLQILFRRNVCLNCTHIESQDDNCTICHCCSSCCECYFTS